MDLQKQIVEEEEAVNANDEDDDAGEIGRMDMENVVETTGHEIRHLDEGAMRVERSDENEGEIEGNGPPRKRKRVKTGVEKKESAYLTLYANTKSCLRKVWDLYFKNDKKGEPNYS